MSGNRARTRAIRARMARTGENYTTAARSNDAEHAAGRDRPGAAAEPTPEPDPKETP